MAKTVRKQQQIIVEGKNGRRFQLKAQEKDNRAQEQDIRIRVKNPQETLKGKLIK